jgi:hypothetical protein
MVLGMEILFCLPDFLFPTLGSTQPPIQWVFGTLSPGLSGRCVKLAIHLEVVPRSRNWIYSSTPPDAFMA